MTIVNGFSIDLEDWFQAITSLSAQPGRWPGYEARLAVNTYRLLAILDEFEVRATFFVLGHVADHYPDLIRHIAAAGHEIGVHGYWHRMVFRLTPQDFAAELDCALVALRPLVSLPIIGHRAPYFSINSRSLWALEVLQEKGFRYDSSFFPTRNILYGYPEAPRFPHRPGGDGLVEFPLATARWGGITWPIAGGFYMRALPFAVIRQGIRQLNEQGQAAIMYMHPWELDTEHRYNWVKPREWVVQYYGRRGLEQKLRCLFSEFRFTTLSDLLE